ASGSGDAGAPGRDGDAGKAGCRCVTYRVKTNGRQVDALLLPGLGCLDENASVGVAFCPARLTELGTTGKHRISSLGGFNGKHVAFGDDGSLPNVKPAERAHHFESHLDVGAIVCRWRLVTEPSHSGQKIGRHIA